MGLGSFTDASTLEGWYVVVKAGDSESRPLGGCHSEEASPTAVTVTDFTSDYGLTANRVSLQWSTASEFGFLGFEVFRSQSLDGARELIAQVASQNPGGLQEASYTLDDADITPGQVYFYWLDILKADGSRETWGPLEQQAGYQRYLPFLTR
jgi:hypothetical protein